MSKEDASDNRVVEIAKPQKKSRHWLVRLLFFLVSMALYAGMMGVAHDWLYPSLPPESETLDAQGNPLPGADVFLDDKSYGLESMAAAFFGLAFLVLGLISYIFLVISTFKPKPSTGRVFTAIKAFLLIAFFVFWTFMFFKWSGEALNHVDGKPDWVGIFFALFWLVGSTGMTAWLGHFWKEKKTNLA